MLRKRKDTGAQVPRQNNKIHWQQLLQSQIWPRKQKCYGNYQTQSLIAVQDSKSLKIDIKQEVYKRTRQGVFAKLESYIYKTCLVHATNNQTCPHVHTLSSCLSQDHHVIYMCPNIIFQILLPCSRLTTSHHVTCHVTAVSHASSSSKKEKKEKKNKSI